MVRTAGRLHLSRRSASCRDRNYNYGHIVFSPDTDNYYFFTSTISASVARADIPTHANFSLR